MEAAKKPYLAVILVQSIYTGMFLLSKAAFDVGMNTFVFVFYRQAAATLFLAPLAFFLEWKKAPPLTFTAFCKIFMLSLCGITMSLDIYGVALNNTSATLAAATTNCLPVITFFLALLLRLETLRLRTVPGIVKLSGVAICTAGAATMAFYQGPFLKLLLHHHLLGNQSQKHQVEVSSSNSSSTWTKGVFLMLFSNVCWGFWLVLQARVIKSYPSMLLLITLQCFLSTIQSAIIAVAVERDFYQWKLGWNVSLLAVAYCGIIVTGVTFYLQTWVIEKKGPVFLAMSTPLNLIFTIVSSAFLLGEIISLGSLLGAILLVVGLYCVLWGKSKEHKMDNGICLKGEAEKEVSESKAATETKSTSPLPV